MRRRVALHRMPIEALLGRLEAFGPEPGPGACEARLQRLAALRAKGLRDAEIGKALRMTANNVRVLVCQHGLAKKRVIAVLSPAARLAQDAVIAALWQVAPSIDAVAKKLGIHRDTVRLRAAKMKLPLRQRVRKAAA